MIIILSSLLSRQYNVALLLVITASYFSYLQESGISYIYLFIYLFKP